METREQKGMEIAARQRIVKSGKTYAVPSQSGSGSYTVKVSKKSKQCDCPDFQKRQAPCKHVFAVECVIERETVTDLDGVTTTTERQTVRISYSQDWEAYNKAQCHEKAFFQKLLHDLCAAVPQPIQQGKNSGRKRLSYADMVFSATYKVYSLLSSRRFMTDLADACDKGFIETVPHFNTIGNYLELEELTPILQELITVSALPLQAVESDFAVDSSGFSTCVYDRWFDEKYGEHVSKHDWVKAHICCGVKTNVVTSAKITGRNGADCPQLPELVMDTARNFDMEQVSADKAYSSLENHEWIRAAHATPFIAFKENASGKVGGLYRKMFYFFQMNREEFMANYHKRSNVESTFGAIKAKFGGSVRSKGEVAQRNEVLCKILAHNLCVLIQSMFEFDIIPDFCVGAQGVQ